MDAVILGASPNALSAARSFGRAGLEVVVAAARSDWTFHRSRYVARLIDLTNLDGTMLAARLAELPAPDQQPFLLATGDRFALFVAQHQQRLATAYCFVSPPFAVLQAIVDKAKLYRAAKENGVPCPNFHVVTSRADIDDAIACVPTPCYVKPALAHEWHRFEGTKLERAETPAELRRILETFVARGLVAVPQDIIPSGDSEVVSVATYIDRAGRAVAWRTKRKLRQYPPGAGDASAQEICEEPEVARLGLRLLAVVGHRGPATVEFRRDSRSGRFVLMEINARTILGQELITRSGFDVPLTAYRDAKGEPLPTISAPAPVRWVNFGTDFRAFRVLRRQGSITTLAWLASIFGARSFAYFAFDDIWPFVARTGKWLGGWWRRIS